MTSHRLADTEFHAASSHSVGYGIYLWLRAKAAVEEGILPGGGVALLRAGKTLDKLKGENEDQRHGIEMVKKALSWPARQIAINAGEDGSVVVGKIQDNDTYAFGFDAQTGKFENLVSHGIIDPTKVVRTARMRPRLLAC